jgi:hypothetical protein
MRAGATSSIERSLRLEQIRLKLHGIAKPNWKRENQKLCERQRLRASLRRILRNEPLNPPLSIDQLSIDQLSIDQLSIDQLSIDQLSIDQPC